MSYIVLLDANVLWPAALRCVLIRAAIRDLYRPVWTARILAEMEYSLAREGRVDPQRIARTVRRMKEHLPHALVEGYEPLIPIMQIDPIKVPGMQNLIARLLSTAMVVVPEISMFRT